MAPELLRKQDPRHRSKADIWAMGVVLYAMVTGTLPFRDDYLPRLIQRIEQCDYDQLGCEYSTLLRDLIPKLLCVDVEERLDAEKILRHPWLRL